MKKILNILLLIFTLCFVGVCFAENGAAINANMYDPGSRNLTMIVNNRSIGDVTGAVSAEIVLDGTSLTDVDVKKLSDTNLPITWCFVVDTSATALLEQKKYANTLAAGLNTKHSNDQFILISFNVDGVNVVGSGKYSNSLFSKLDYKNEGGDVSAAITKAISELDYVDTPSKKAIILITDGNCNSDSIEGLLRTIEEEETPYPIYTWGMAVSEDSAQGPIKYNDDYLLKLQDLSNFSNGVFYDDRKSQDPSAAIYSDVANSLVVSGTVPGEYSHEKGFVSLDLRLFNRSGSVINTGMTNMLLFMPQIDADVNIDIQEPEETETPDLEETETPEPVETETPEPVETETPEPTVTPTGEPGIFDKLKEKLGDQYLLVLIAGVMLIVLLVLIILTISTTQKKEETEPEEEFNIISMEDVDSNGNNGTAQFYEPIRVTIYSMDSKSRFSASAEMKDQDSIYFGRNNMSGVIGMGGIPVISEKHFLLSYEDGKLYLKDCNSTNGTYIVYPDRRERVYGKIILDDGMIIGAADRDFRIVVSAL